MPTLIAQVAPLLLGVWLLESFGASIALAVPCGAAMLNILMALAPVALRHPW